MKSFNEKAFTQIHFNCHVWPPNTYSQRFGKYISTQSFQACDRLENRPTSPNSERLAVRNSVLCASFSLLFLFPFHFDLRVFLLLRVPALTVTLSIKRRTCRVTVFLILFPLFLLLDNVALLSLCRFLLFLFLYFFRAGRLCRGSREGRGQRRRGQEIFGGHRCLPQPGFHLAVAVTATNRELYDV